MAETLSDYATARADLKNAACFIKGGHKTEQAPDVRSAIVLIPRKVLMIHDQLGFGEASQKQQRALSRWGSEGGAGQRGPQEVSLPEDIPELTNAELVQLRIRVIALENLVIALLAEGSERQVEVAREMAAYIAPRPGFTQHPLTVHAAAHMNDLINRAGRFRAVAPS